MEGKKNTLQFLMASKWNAHKYYDQSYSFWITAFLFSLFICFFLSTNQVLGMLLLIIQMPMFI